MWGDQGVAVANQYDGECVGAVDTGEGESIWYIPLEQRAECVSEPDVSLHRVAHHCQLNCIDYCPQYQGLEKSDLVTQLV
jgi:hypothetical protein